MQKKSNKSFFILQPFPVCSLGMNSILFRKMLDLLISVLMPLKRMIHFDDLKYHNFVVFYIICIS